MKDIVIAIDGPAAAGKSTVAKLVAESLNYSYIDTGAMYRAVALYIKRNKVDYLDEALLKNHLKNITIHLDEQKRIFLNDQDVSKYIRTAEISNLVSVISAISSVRIFLVDLQKHYAKMKKVVIEGRDIGSFIAPNAELKIFLTASNESRVERRRRELKKRGEDVPFEVLLKEIVERDHRDSTREFSPLVKTSDAILVDSSDIDATGVALKIVELAKKIINE